MSQYGGVKRRLVLPLVCAVACALAVSAVVIQGILSPAAAVRPSGPTEEQIDAYVQNTLDETWLNTTLAEDYEQPFAAPAPLLPVEEWSVAFASCMAEAGYDVEGFGWAQGGGYELFTRDGGYVEDVDKQFTFYGCIATHPQDPISSGDLISPEQLAYTYDYYERWSLPCLSAWGIPLSDVLSREEFLDTETSGNWSPYFSAPSRGTDDGIAELRMLCGPEIPAR